MKMDISLTPQTESFVRYKLNSGSHHSLSDLINEALFLMSEREKRLVELKTDIQIGIEQAERNELVDAEVVFAALQKRATK
jgi:antitoxin ParD1/3/4